jgi:hypothetical protein
VSAAWVVSLGDIGARGLVRGLLRGPVMLLAGSVGDEQRRFVSVGQTADTQGRAGSAP